jgi:hypothetical protein
MKTYSLDNERNFWRGKVKYRLLAAITSLYGHYIKNDAPILTDADNFTDWSGQESAIDHCSLFKHSIYITYIYIYKLYKINRS